MNNRYAFFDVDETILNFKSMFSFHRYWLSKTNPLGGYANYFFSFMKFKYLGKRYSRQQVNRQYYRQYAGIYEDELKQWANVWWNELINNHSIFNPKVLEHFFRHKTNGIKTVLISGSMGQCLEPLKLYLGADEGIWTDLEVQNGMLTGNILDEPNIGEGKMRRILKFLKTRSVNHDLLNSYAYGDHVSDIPMLNLVGNPYFVRGGVPRRFLSSSLIN